MKNNNLKITFSLIFVVTFMLFLSFAAVPLYKLFCQVTGYGGTPKIVNIENEIKVAEKKIKIVAGKFGNAEGPVKGHNVEPIYFDIEL